MNVESGKFLKPGRIGRRDGIGAALREAIHGRFDRLPSDMIALLNQMRRA